MVFASRIACLLFLKLIIQAASKPPWLLRSCFQLPRKCSGKKNVKASLLTSLLPSLLASLLPSLLASSLGESDPTLGGGGAQKPGAPHIYIYIRHRALKAHRACLIQCQICKLLQKKGVEDSLLLKGNRSQAPFRHFPRIAFFD